MKPELSPDPLPADFADRVDALRREADVLRQGDIAHLLEMAEQIADRRINAQGIEVRLTTRKDELRHDPKRGPPRDLAGEAAYAKRPE